MASSPTSLFSHLPSLHSQLATSLSHPLLNPIILSFPLSSATTRRSNLSLSSSPQSPPLKVFSARNSGGETADPVYRNRLVNLFVNRVLRNGNKSLAFFIVYRALKRIQIKTQSNPLLVLRQAVRTVTPEVTVKARRVAGSTHQVPVELDGVKGRALAIRWLLKAARERQGPDMAFKLSCELMDAANGSGNAVRRKEMVLKMAEANRAFVHFR